MRIEVHLGGSVPEPAQVAAHCCAIHLVTRTPNHRGPYDLQHRPGLNPGAYLYWQVVEQVTDCTMAFRADAFHVHPDASLMDPHFLPWVLAHCHPATRFQIAAQFESHPVIAQLLQTVRHLPAPALPQSRTNSIQPLHVNIVGAGVAGHALVATLSALPQVQCNWWDLDADSSLGLAGSTQPYLAEHPHLSVDDNPLAQLTRLAHQCLTLLPEEGISTLGRLQLASDTGQALQMQASCEALKWDPQWVQFIAAGELSTRWGLSDRPGALYWPEARVMNTAVWFRAVRECAGLMPQPIKQERLVKLLQQRLSGQDSQTPAIWILAAGASTGQLLHPIPGATQVLSMEISGGASSLVNLAVEEAALPVVGGQAYSAPAGLHHRLIGATHCAASEIGLVQHHAENLQRWSAMTGLPLHKAAHDLFPGVRVASPDHLPVIGGLPHPLEMMADLQALRQDDRRALPELAGVYLATGFGARGLLWAALAAQIFAARCSGRPVPVSAALLDAISPHRFWRRRVRRDQAFL